MPAVGGQAGLLQVYAAELVVEMSIIAFKHCYTIERVAPDMTFLLSEKENILLRGKIYYSLAPLLQKPSYTIEEIVDRLIKENTPLHLYYALQRLKDKGFIEETDLSISRKLGAFYCSLGINPKLALNALKTTKIYVKTFGDFDLDSLHRIFHPLGLIFAEGPSDADFFLLIVQDYLQKEIEQFNTQGRPWMLLKPFGQEIWIGPFFDSKKTGCFECLAYRLRKNRLEQSFISQRNRQKDLPFLSVASIPTSENLAYQLAGIEILKYITLQDKYSLLGKMLSYDLATAKMNEHILTKRPQCACCGDSKRKNSIPLILQSRGTTEYQDGGVRCITPEETIEKNACHISPITGIVDSLQNRLLKPNSSINTYVAGHNFALSNEFKGILRHNPRSVSGGKGRTPLQAKASALSEAIERYSGLFEGTEIRKRASFSEIKNEAIDPRSCLLYSQKQYANRSAWNEKCHSFHKIPSPFDENRVIEWTPVWSLKTHQSQYIPTAYCYFAYPLYEESDFCQADSNGNASGNFIEEAISHGLFELIERDSVSIWWYNRLKRPLVDLASFNDPYFSHLIADYREMGRELWVIDITCDLNIPSFVALSRKIKGDEVIVFGFGCDLNASVAISRALTEMNQILCVLPTEDIYNSDLGHEQDIIDYQVIHEWLHRQTLEKQPYLVGTVPAKTARDYPAFTKRDVLDDIQICQQKIEEAGMEVFVLDQSRPDLGLKVAKVIVPGLLHFWPRFAQGRLYDVPVKMGWLNEPTKEEDLNPISVFI